MNATKEMKELKITHTRKKSNIDASFLKSDSSPNRSPNISPVRIRLQEQKIYRDSQILITNKSESRVPLSTTTPSFIKYKTDDDFLEEEEPKVPKRKQAKEMLDLMSRYDESSFVKAAHLTSKTDLFQIENRLSFQRDKEKSIDHQVDYEIYNKNNNHINSPVVGSNISRCEDLIFEPLSERNASFMKNISINNSNFFQANENKDNDVDVDVVLNISNLDIETSFAEKKNYFEGGNRLQSEEKYVNCRKRGYTIEDSMNTDHNTNNKNLIHPNEKIVKSNFKSVIILCFLLLIVFMVLGVFLYLFLFRH